MRNAGVAVAVLVVLTAAWIMLAENGAPPLAESALDVAPGPVGSSADVRPLPPPGPEPATPIEPRPLEREAVEDAPDARLTQPAATRVALEGRVRLELADGSIDEQPTGTIVFHDAPRMFGRSLPAARVVEGRFTIQAPLGDRLLVDRLELEGAPAVVVGRNQFEVTEDPVVIHARRLPGLLLHVTDAEFGHELGDVTLTAMPALRRPEQQLVSRGQAPLHVELPTRLAQESRLGLSVAVPGYAPGQLSVNPVFGGEHHVALGRAASLDVRLEGATLADGAVLRLWVHGEEGPPLRAERPEPPRPTHIEDLAAGPYDLRLELGAFHTEPIVLASAEVALSAGESREILLTIAALPVVQEGWLAGTLLLPAPWRDDNDHLDVYPAGRIDPFRPLRRLPIDGMQPVPGHPDLLAWEVGEIPCGGYDLSIRQPGRVVSVDVGPQGVYDAHVDLQPAAALTVEILDALTGEPASAATLVWRTLMPGGDRPLHRQSTQRDQDSGLYEALVPTGPIELSAGDAGLATHWTTVQVPPGGGRFTIEALPRYEVTLVLKDGKQVVPIPGGLRAVTWEHLDGDGRCVGYDADARGMFATLDQPGRYRVTLGTPAGYATIPALELEVGRERLRHRVALRRP